MQAIKLRKTVVVLLSLVAIMTFLPSCAMKSNYNSIKGNKVIVKKIFNTNEFYGIEVDNAFNVKLIQSDKTKLVLETDSNLVKYIDINVDVNGKLIIRQKDIKKNIKFTTLNLYIYTPKINSIELTDASIMDMPNFKTDKMTIEVGDASNLSGELECVSLEMEIGDASNVMISGKVKTCNININDASELDAQKMIANDVTISANDASNVKINVLENLSYDLKDASSLSYKGNPIIGKRLLRDDSSVNKIDN